MKIVEVSWNDPTVDAGWQEDDHELPLAILKSYGILVSNTERQVCIAGSYDPEEQKYADRSRFPQGCVINIRTIEEI